MTQFEQLATPPWLYLNSSPYPYKKALASATSSLLFVLDTYDTHCDLKSPVSTEEQKQRLLVLISEAESESKAESAAEASSTFTDELRRSTFTDEGRRSPGGRPVSSAMTTYLLKWWVLKSLPAGAAGWAAAMPVAMGATEATVGATTAVTAVIVVVASEAVSKKRHQ